MSYLFEIPIHPVPKARPRTFTNKHGLSRTYTPKKTKDFEGLVRDWIAANHNKHPFEGPLKLELTFMMPVPKSYSKKSRNWCLSKFGTHTKKPDLDNLEKSVMDAAEGILYYNDSQICSKISNKVWAEKPMIVLELSFIE